MKQWIQNYKRLLPQLRASCASCNLSSLNLDGEISPAIGDLKSLLSLDMRGNHLSGQIPDEIGDCSSLKSLDLSFNELYGDIPFSFKVETTRTPNFEKQSVNWSNSLNLVPNSKFKTLRPCTEYTEWGNT